MVEQHSKAHRSRLRDRLLRGTLTGALALTATGDLAALPLGKASPTTAGPTLIQSADGAAPTNTGRQPFTELNQALAAARARLEELSRAAEVVAKAADTRRQLEALQEENARLVAELERAAADAERLRAAEARLAELTSALQASSARAEEADRDLAAARWQSAQLETSLAEAQAAREQIETEARAATEALEVKVAALSRSAGESAAEVGRLQEQLDATEQRVAIATSSRNDAEARLVEMQEVLDTAALEEQRLGQQLEQARMATAKAAQERDQAVERHTVEQASLAAARAELERSAAANRSLEQEVASLREAATTATDAARQNLLAVETRIEELNAALAGIEPAAAPGPGDGSGTTTEEVRVVAATDGAIQSDAGATTPVPAVAADGVGPVPLPTEDGSASTDLELIKSVRAAGRPADDDASALIADLPLENRLQVQALMADLNAGVDDQGLLMTVPGASLFALNSDQVQRSAYDTLAKVAELIDIYDDRSVVIRGHTDSIGDASYNQTLSERRATLVKDFFVDNFDVAKQRLATEGLGEKEPISSNATLDGRRANRRVEVLILN